MLAHGVCHAGSKQTTVRMLRRAICSPIHNITGGMACVAAIFGPLLHGIGAQQQYENYCSHTGIPQCCLKLVVHCIRELACGLWTVADIWSGLRLHNLYRTTLGAHIQFACIVLSQYTECTLERANIYTLSMQHTSTQHATTLSIGPIQSRYNHCPVAALALCRFCTTRTSSVLMLSCGVKCKCTLVLLLNSAWQRAATCLEPLQAPSLQMLPWQLNYTSQGKGHAVGH